jgi:uncharacterized membrane protein YphA (DoxX/SURF4 family)
VRVLEKWQPQLPSVLRIMSGLLFLQHGTQKMLAFPVLALYLAAAGPGPWSLDTARLGEKRKAAG